MVFHRPPRQLSIEGNQARFYMKHSWLHGGSICSLRGLYVGHTLNPFRSPPRAFISYARSDGADIAADLHARLEREHAEITLWLDRTQMIGGIGWWKQITEALDKVEILVMILTPAAMQSDIAAQEWRYARQQGVRVCPVMQDASGLAFEYLPNWMRKAHCYDLHREWETFVAFLQSAEKANRVPFMAPDLPARCIERRAQIEALLSCLLDETGKNPQSNITALQGAGGYGKTTLAGIVCHQAQVIDRHTACVDAVAVTADGTRAISGARDKTLRVWSLETGDRRPERNCRYSRGIPVMSDPSCFLHSAVR